MKISLLLALVFAFSAFGAGVPLKPQTDTFQLGKDGSLTDPNLFIFQVGDGASNPRLLVSKTLKTFDFNKDVSVTGALSTSGVIAAGGALTSTGNLTVGGGIINVGGTVNRLRFNNGKLQSSVDSGTTYKNAGSGGSGAASGVNLLENGSFEDGVTTEFTNSGGTFTSQTYTNATTDGNDLKFARFVCSSPGQYFETTLKTIPDSLGIGGMANFDALVTSGTWNYSIIDSVGNTLGTSATVNPNTVWTPQPTLAYPNPTVSKKLRVTCVTAGTINVDHTYLGGNKNTVTATYSNDYDWTPYVATSPNGSFGTLTITFCDHKRVDRNIYIRCTFAPSATNATQARISLPSGVIPDVTGQVLAGRYDVNSASTTYFGNGGVYVNPATAYFLFAPYTSTLAGGNTQNANVVSGSGNVINIQAGPFPVVGWTSGPNVGSAFTSDQSGWFIDGNIGGAGTNFNLGVANQTSYIGIEQASADLVLRTGSAPAKIACSGTNPATGLTCAAGNESIGLAFNPPYAGFFDVCSEFGHETSYGSASTISITFQLAETTSATQTIIQEGGSRANSQLGNGGTAETTGLAHSTCGTFYFNSTAERTVRLMFEQAVTGTISTSVLTSDRSAALGQRDVRITVKPSTMNVARPVLTGAKVANSFSESSNSTVVTEVCRIDNNGTASVNNASGLCSGWMQSASRASTGIVNLVFVPGYFSTAPVCTVSTITTLSVILINNLPTTSGTQTYSWIPSSGAVTDVGFFISCTGKK